MLVRTYLCVIRNRDLRAVVLSCCDIARGHMMFTVHLDMCALEFLASASALDVVSILVSK
jgi:hypothetical protein